MDGYLRFYDPNLQRWINRDPTGEAGGINLYGFTFNAPDPLGLAVRYDENDDIIVDDSTMAGDSVRRNRSTQEAQDMLDKQALVDAGRAIDVACMLLPWDRFFRPLKYLGGLAAARKAAKGPLRVDAAGLRLPPTRAKGADPTPGEGQVIDLVQGLESSQWRVRTIDPKTF